MFPLSNLAPRPTFTRKTSDVSDAEAHRHILPPSPAPSFSAVDGFDDVALGRGQRARRFAEEAAQKTANVGNAVLPYWREGIFAAFAIAITSWLGVVSRRLADLEALPWCDELISEAVASAAGAHPTTRAR